MSRPNLFELESWKRHERNLLEVFGVALVRLACHRELPAEEDEINRKLLFLARRANHQLVREGRGSSSNIYYETSNQPLESDIDRSSRESKRPDFKCGLVDAQSGLDLFFDVECKRLGTPASRGWVLNANYTRNGVRRFEDPEWGYGAGTPSGAMIGYIQSMTHDTILCEVNVFGTNQGFAPIGREDARWQEGDVTVLTQRLDRRLRPSPFRITHLWVDLRHCYN